MSLEIISMGGLLVEIIRKEHGKTLSEPADFTGPYPSGDTPIFIYAAAKLGKRCGFIGSCGDDAFGKCVYDRLNTVGVDMTHIRKIPGLMTGTTFVMYEEDGTRRFMYHLQNTGSAVVTIDDVSSEYFKDCKWVHYTAFNLEISDSLRSGIYRSMQLIDDNTIVSFDPNVRFELYSPEQIKEMCEPIIKRANILLPSQYEFSQMYGKTDEEVCTELMEKGKLVILKLADQGCRIYEKGKIMDVAPFQIVEIDATGAGDIFCAAFAVARLDGRSVYNSAVFANAAGALSVTRMGPMEGTFTKDELEEFLRTRQSENF